MSTSNQDAEVSICVNVDPAALLQPHPGLDPISVDNFAAEVQRRLAIEVPEFTVVVKCEGPACCQVSGVSAERGEEVTLVAQSVMRAVRHCYEWAVRSEMVLPKSATETKKTAQ